MATAAQKVLNTVELLENILLHLDTKTLLLSQATSRLFHQTIQSSSGVQRKLFMRPTIPSDDLGMNPLLQRSLSSCSEHVYDHSKGARVKLCLGILVTVPDDGYHRHYLASFLVSQGAHEPEPATATWRRMLICQPQHSGTFVGRIGRPRPTKTSLRVTVSVTPETRFGDVVDAVVAKWLEDKEKASEMKEPLVTALPGGDDGV